MPDYVSKAELNQLVRSAQANSNVPCPRLIEVTRLMAEGIWGRYRYNVGGEEDAVGEAYVVLMKVIPKMNPEANCFSYLTTCLKNAYLGVGAKQTRHDQFIQKLREAAPDAARAYRQPRSR